MDFVGPGLTGVGSLFFRNEEEILSNCGSDAERFHDDVITPFKGELEVWYAQHKSLKLYFLIIYLTAASIIYRQINTLSYFEGLPTPPPEINRLLTQEQRQRFR